MNTATVSSKDATVKKSKYAVDLEELVGNTASQRNWRGIAIALLVILIVCALIITAVILVTPRNEDESLGEKFTLDNFFDQNYKPKEPPTQWIGGEDNLVYRNDDGALVEFDCNTNSTSIIMDNTTFRSLDTGQFILSPYKQYVLLKHDIIPVYRHSTKASYSYYDKSTRATSPVEGPGGLTLQYVAWSPQGHSLVLVQENNIYYKSDVDTDAVLLADGGIDGTIYNGIPDWVYEEEILGTDHALWWSPNGAFLCYAVFNDTQVPKYYYPVYGDMQNPYGEIVSIPYPKPGYANPTFQLKVVKISDKTTVELQPPATLKNKEYYFMTVAWQDNNSVLVNWVNRPQNFSTVTFCSAESGLCQLSLREDGHGGWVDMNFPPWFAADGSRYFWILPQKDAGAGFFKNVIMVEITKPKGEDRRLFLTHNQWEAIKIVGYDNVEKIVYFIGTGGDPRKRHLYSVTMDRKTTCLTCNKDDRCQYVKAMFSSSAKFYVLGCLGPGIPYYSVRSVERDTEVIRLENNTALYERLSKKAMPEQKDFQIEIEGGEKIWGKLLLPPQIKMNEILTYPLVLEVYGGPGTQQVTDQFKIGWETYLTSSRSFIYAYADGRGTGARGQKFLHQVFRRLGTVEVDDAIAAGKLYSKEHYVDSNKMAIWGWSYGGFMTLSALGREKGPFPCGISVAPVTDWRYYDSVYTEKFMGIPRADDNLQGYKDSNVSSHAANMKKSKFLLVHGTGDDNVHFQNSAQLIKALTEANVYFRMQIYTDKHHGLLGGNTRRHLYETLEDFLAECFNGTSDKFGRRQQSLKEK